MKIALLALQGLQLAFLLLHDWVPLGRLSNLAAVRSSDPTGRLVWTTVLSAAPFALVFGVSCAFGTGPWPTWLKTWLLFTYLAAAAGAIQAWWGPYLIWSDPERSQRYRTRFAGTMRFLPERHGFAPDTLHLAFHACILATLALCALL